MNGSSVMHTIASMVYRRQNGSVGGSVVSFSYTPFSAHEQNETDEMATITGISPSQHIIKQCFFTQVSTVTLFHLTSSLLHPKGSTFVAPVISYENKATSSL